MKKKMLLILISNIIIFLILYFYIFWIKSPFIAEITQDRPIIKALCNMQVACHSGTGPYTCREDPKSDSFKRLSRWDGFKGCNNLTIGYQKDDGRIILEYCGCGGWM